MPQLDLKIMRARDAREAGNFRIEQINRAKEERENQLIEEILKKAPKILHWYLTEELMLKDLLRYGQCSRKIPYGEYEGLETRQKIKKAFKELQKVVGSLLKISFDDESHRTEVRLEITK